MISGGLGERGGGGLQGASVRGGSGSPRVPGVNSE